MQIKEATKIVGGLSVPSKMPCFGYSISAKRCVTGSKLVDTKGSVCEGCYALKGRYGFDNVQNAMERRFESLSDPRWISAMVTLINKKAKGFFRWHDSGDLQGAWHLDMIASVATQSPNVQHWLPTREYGFVREFVEGGGIIPDNLTIRLSAYMVDGPLPTAAAERLGVLTSGVSATDYNCPASKQENQCKDCRFCWDKEVPNVSYHKH